MFAGPGKIVEMHAQEFKQTFFHGCFLQRQIQGGQVGGKRRTGNINVSNATFNTYM